ncbi:toll-like receptor 12 [Protopterus annectens]|uniref:toll-like receptor 12 n=1 Tax=Protopterus annectens TaxID=7888 RepID=UPI001CFAD1F5|nr:toll-like receptor 12 [Protopterus annectens]
MESHLQSIHNLTVKGSQEQDYGFVKTICQVASRFRVKHLTVSINRMYNISNEIIAKCVQLESLDVHSCGITSSESGFLYTMKKLIRLEMQGNDLKVINICPENKTFTAQLTYLDLSSNSIYELKSGQFSCMTYLRYLRLRSNEMETIEESAFQGLEQLIELDLTDNRIQMIEKKQLKHMKVLSSLFLRGNNIKVISPGALKDLPLHTLSLTVIENGRHITLLDFPAGVRTLYLETKGDLDAIVSNASHLTSLENLYLYGSGILFWFEDCASAPMATTLKELHLKTANPFCSDKRFDAFVNLEILYLQNQASTYTLLPLNIQTLKVLYLEDVIGTIDVLPEQTQLLFRNLTLLRCLILKNSGIVHFTAAMFQDLVSLEVFVVQRQNILILESELFQTAISLNLILFQGCVLQCDCHNDWIIRWAATRRKMLLKLGHVKCLRLHLHEHSNFVKFLEDVCEYSYEFMFFTVTIAFLLLFLVFTIVYLKAGWFIIYLLYSLRMHLSRLTGKASYKTQYIYDVFVSYSSKDERWVVTELLPNLEHKGPPFLKVCLHNRDFEVGKDILDNIVDSINSSRKTICVITRHYLRSEWCSLEMRMATYRLLAESQDLLMLVFLERIFSHEISAFHRLARMTKKKTYIDWPEGENEKQMFWGRLKRTLMEAKNHDHSIHI